jgi:CheY-like chemotaxis protein
MITHPPPAGGSETILVVENEDAVRGLIVEMLVGKGYRVLSSASGPEAQAAAKAYDGPLHLLLTDVIMPGMNGPVLADILQRQYEKMKVLFMSGYADDVLGEHGVLDEGTSFLHKPFTTDGLTSKVRYVLDHDPEASPPD